MADEELESESPDDVVTESELKGWIQETVDSAIAGLKSHDAPSGTKARVSRTEAQTTSVKDEVERAIKEARAQEAAAEREKMLDSRLDSLEKAKEDVPAQFRKITRLMWGEQ